MTHIQKQINKAVNFLKQEQQDFHSKLVYGVPNRHKLSVDMDINDDEIIFYFDTDKQTGFTVALAAEFYGNEVITLSVDEVYVDTDNGLETVSGEGQSELLLECKKLVHDAVYFNLADDITTDFYHEVYA